MPPGILLREHYYYVGVLETLAPISMELPMAQDLMYPGTQRLGRKKDVGADTMCARSLWSCHAGPGVLFLQTHHPLSILFTAIMHQADWARLRPIEAAIAYNSITLRLPYFGMGTHPCHGLVSSVWYPLNIRICSPCSNNHDIGLRHCLAISRFMPRSHLSFW